MNVKTNKTKLLWLGVLAGVLGITSKLFYRPLVIEYNIQDFGISDCLPNFFAAFSLCTLTAYLKSKGQIKSMIAVCGGILVYEIEQIWTSMIFDYLDVIASLVGLAFSILIFTTISNKVMEPDLSKSVIDSDKTFN